MTTQLIDSVDLEVKVIRDLILSGKVTADQSTLVRLQTAVFNLVPLVSHLKDEILKLTSKDTNTGEKVGAGFSLIGDLISEIANDFPIKTRAEREEAKEERQEAREEAKAERLEEKEERLKAKGRKKKDVGEEQKP